MKISCRSILKPHTLGLFLIVPLLSSCATTHPPAARRADPVLPADVTMNRDAGRGNRIYVTLRLEDGQELPCLVDTGGGSLLLDKSLEPKLGECLGTTTVNNFGDEYDANCYAAPRLYLGDTPLRTGRYVLTSNYLEKSSTRAGRRVMGILGMGCLRHYCIQLDFQAGKMRFLDPNSIEPAKLGEAFPLTFLPKDRSETEWTRPYIHHRHLVGEEVVDLLVDTGHGDDGALEPAILRREIRKHTLRVEPDANNPDEPEHARLAKCLWRGATYTDLFIGNGRNTTEADEGENSLGLRFLARHLVTFDFPGGTMYLKRTSRGPLFTDELRAAGKAAARSVFPWAGKLMRNGQLPGWSKKDRGTIRKVAQFHPDPDTMTLHAAKKRDASTYHYEFSRTSKDSPWTLQRAWRTDPDGRTIEEYPVP